MYVVSCCVVCVVLCCVCVVLCCVCVVLCCVVLYVLCVDCETKTREHKKVCCVMSV